MTARIDDTALRLGRAVESVRFGLAELALLEPHGPREVAALVAMLRRYLDRWPGREISP